MTGPATGRFPGFDVLSQAGHWDQVTTDLITARTGPQQAPEFFTETEQSDRRRPAQPAHRPVRRTA